MLIFLRRVQIFNHRSFYQFSTLNVGSAEDLYECHSGSKERRCKIRQRISRWQWITESRQFRENSYGPTCCGDGREGCLEWVGRVATKSAASGTTNQIFALAARSCGPLLLFICKAGLNYGGGKGGDGSGGSCGPGRTIVLLADRKHHCATTARAVATI